MIKRNLNKFEQTGIIAVVMILALLLYTKKVYKPEVKRFVKLRKEWIEISSEVKTLNEDYGKQTLFSAIQEEKENLRQAKSELGKIKNTGDKEKDPAGILTVVNQIAEQYNLKIRDFNPVDGRGLQLIKEGGEKDFHLRRSFYNLELAGSFINLKGFLKDLAYLSGQVGIMNIAVEREGENKSLKITLLLSI